MIQLNDIRKLHLELSSLCNARCPQCPRNFYGYPYNRGYVETNLSLEKLQSILSVDFLKQIDEILINGNFGDFIMNPESIEIITWLKSVTSNAFIHISTNGGARDQTFWQTLAKLGVEVNFCIDGLEDTHHIYRQDTTYNQVIRNATTYITAGGRANWVMTEFNHNQHQFDEAQRRSIDLKFFNFIIRKTNRDTGPIYDRSGKNIFKMKSMTGFPDQLSEKFIVNKLKVEKMSVVNKNQKISCESLRDKSLYIAADGTVEPCCYLNVSNYLNNDIVGYKKINTDTVEQSIVWFNQVLEKIDKNPLTMCSTICSSK